MSNNPVFVIGTGRCGTHFLESLMSDNTSIDANHIQNADADSFYKYCAWNDLSVDLGGFIQPRRDWIREAGERGEIYFESNPYLTFHVNTLAREFDAKFIFIIRNPKDVVKSHVVKGWYENTLDVIDQNKALGYQYDMRPNHFFGRIIPRGPEYSRWSKLTRIGRIAWMWNAVNLGIKRQLDQLQPDRMFFSKIEDLDFEQYELICDFIGADVDLNSKRFHIIRDSKPGKGKPKEISKWSKLEHEEYASEISEGLRVFNY